METKIVDVKADNELKEGEVVLFLGDHRKYDSEIKDCPSVTIELLGGIIREKKDSTSVVEFLWGVYDVSNNEIVCIGQVFWGNEFPKGFHLKKTERYHKLMRSYFTEEGLEVAVYLANVLKSKVAKVVSLKCDFCELPAEIILEVSGSESEAAEYIRSCVPHVVCATGQARARKVSGMLGIRVLCVNTALRENQWRNMIV